MFSRKLLMSLLTVGILATVACGGTWAYFSDSASTAQNTVKAGTIILSVENGIDTGATDDVVVTAEKAKPGDTDIPVKLLRIENLGTLNGKLTAIAKNARDTKGLGKYLIIKVGGQTIYDRGMPVEAVLTPNPLLGRHHVASEVTYTFVNTGDPQNEVQGDKFTFDIVFTLKQELAP